MDIYEWDTINRYTAIIFSCCGLYGFPCLLNKEKKTSGRDLQSHKVLETYKRLKSPGWSRQTFWRQGECSTSQKTEHYLVYNPTCSWGDLGDVIYNRYLFVVKIWRLWLTFLPDLGTIMDLPDLERDKKLSRNVGSKLISVTSTIFQELAVSTYLRPVWTPPPVLP